MTWQVHSAWLARQFNGTEFLDLDGTGADVIRLGIVTNASLNADTDSLYTSLTAVATGTGWTGPVNLSGLTCGLNGSFNLVFDANDPASIAQDAGGGFANGRTLVIYDTTNNYILASHSEAANFGNVSGPINITLAAGGIWQLTI